MMSTLQNPLLWGVAITFLAGAGIWLYGLWFDRRTRLIAQIGEATRWENRSDDTFAEQRKSFVFGNVNIDSAKFISREFVEMEAARHQA